MFQENWKRIQKTPMLYSFFTPKKSCRLSENVRKYCRAGQATDDNMVHTHCMLDTNTHSEYVILIAFALQQWLKEVASILRYTYTVCLVLTEITASISHTIIVHMLSRSYPCLLYFISLII